MSNSAANFSVVVNSEQQFSIWRVDRELPAGWETVGVTGSSETCLDWIESNWTDMRPLGLRDAMSHRSAVEKSK